MAKKVETNSDKHFSLGEIIPQISHELQNQLTSINSRLQLLQMQFDGSKESTVSKQLYLAQQQIFAHSRLLDELSTLAFIELSARQAQPSTTTVSAYCRLVSEIFMQPISPEKQIAKMLLSLNNQTELLSWSTQALKEYLRLRNKSEDVKITITTKEQRKFFCIHFKQTLNQQKDLKNDPDFYQKVGEGRNSLKKTSNKNRVMQEFHLLACTKGFDLLGITFRSRTRSSTIEASLKFRLLPVVEQTN
ncbi:MAG: hypothetical protein ACOZAN_04150 [Patescibacteria group bacterium]